MASVESSILLFTFFGSLSKRLAIGVLISSNACGLGNQWLPRIAAICEKIKTPNPAISDAVKT